MSFSPEQKGLLEPFPYLQGQIQIFGKIYSIKKHGHSWWESSLHDVCKSAECRLVDNLFKEETSKMSSMILKNHLRNYILLNLNGFCVICHSSLYQHQNNSYSCSNIYFYSGKNNSFYWNENCYFLLNIFIYFVLFKVNHTLKIDPYRTVFKKRPFSLFCSILLILAGRSVHKQFLRFLRFSGWN